jgi:hypothetical protein
MIINLARLILAYLIAAGISSYVSLSLAATVWSSIWTYVALLVGLVLSSIALWLAIVVFGLLGFGALLTSAWAVDRIKRR